MLYISVHIHVYTCILHSCCYRAAQSRSSEDHCLALFEKGQRIEQEFAEFFTGKNYTVLYIVHVCVHVHVQCKCMYTYNVSACTIMYIKCTYGWSWNVNVHVYTCTCTCTCTHDQIGMIVTLFWPTAVVEGNSLNDIYDKVKNVIHEQSGNYIWVPASDVSI